MATIQPVSPIFGFRLEHLTFRIRVFAFVMNGYPRRSPLFTCRIYIRIDYERWPCQLQYRQRPMVSVLHNRGHSVCQPRDQGPSAPVVPREHAFLPTQVAPLFILLAFQPQWMKTSNSMNGGQFVDSFTGICQSSIASSIFTP